jgi:hypothetical protein
MRPAGSPQLASVIEPHQHRLDFPPQRRVVAACLRDKGFAARRIVIARGMEYLGDLTPTFRRHGDFGASSASDAKQLRAVLPDCAVLLDKQEIDLMDERRGLQRLSIPLAPQMGARPPSQLPMHYRHQPVARVIVPHLQA